MVEKQVTATRGCTLKQRSAIFLGQRTSLKRNFFVYRPLKNHNCVSNKTARIYSACKSSKFFRVSLKKKKRSSSCDGANSAKCFKFKAFDVKTQTDRLRTSPVFADDCFNAFNPEKHAARYRTPRKPAPGCGPVFADRCIKTCFS